MLDPVRTADMDGSVTASDDDTWVSVGTQWRVWWLIVPALACIAALTAALLAAFAHRPVIARLAILLAAASGLWAAVAAIVIWKGRRWIRIREDGFDVRSRQGETGWLDRQVTALASVRVPTFHSGQLTSEQRQLSLWLDGGPAPTRIDTVNHFAPGVADPLQPLIDRLSLRLVEQARDALRRHIPVSGESWQWDGQFLDYDRDDGSTGRVSADEISSLEVLSGRLRVWKSNEPLPFFTVPLQRRNAWLLWDLLNETLTERGNPPATPETGDGLGRLLFERRPTRLFGGFVSGLGTLALLVATTLIVAGAVRGRGPAAIVGCALTPAAVLIILAGTRLMRTVLRCHEAGLIRTGFTGTTQLRFDEVDVFAFDARRQYSHGKYTGTMVTLVFAVRDRPNAGIFHTETIPHINDELEELRERVSEHIAHRLARTYATTRQVQWTPELSFEETGLRYVRRQFWRRTPPRLIPYDSILEYEVDQEWLHIWTNDQERAAVKVRTSAPNFYPGLIVLEGLIGPMETEAHHTGPTAVPQALPRNADSPSARQH